MAVYPVKVTVEWQGGSRTWRLEGLVEPWRGPQGRVIQGRPDNGALDDILNMAQRHGLDLDHGRAGT